MATDSHALVKAIWFWSQGCCGVPFDRSECVVVYMGDLTIEPSRSWTWDDIMMTATWLGQMLALAAHDSVTQAVCRRACNRPNPFFFLGLYKLSQDVSVWRHVSV